MDSCNLFPRCIYLLNFLKHLQETPSPNRTLDLASALETGAAGNKPLSDLAVSNGTARSVMTIAFQFAFEGHMQENVASMARQYVRSIISSVQRVALALSPSLGTHAGLRSPLGTPEAHTLARWISQSYRYVLVLEVYDLFTQPCPTICFMGYYQMLLPICHIFLFKKACFLCLEFSGACKQNSNYLS